MDTLATLLFLGFILLVVFVISSNIDLVQQKRRGVQKVNGRLPDGPAMRWAYIAMGFVVLFFLFGSGGGGGESTFDSELDYECVGSMRC